MDWIYALSIIVLILIIVYILKYYWIHIHRSLFESFENSADIMREAGYVFELDYGNLKDDVMNVFDSNDYWIDNNQIHTCNFQAPIYSTEPYNSSDLMISDGAIYSCNYDYDSSIWNWEKDNTIYKTGDMMINTIDTCNLYQRLRTADDMESLGENNYEILDEIYPVDSRLRQIQLDMGHGFSRRTAQDEIVHHYNSNMIFKNQTTMMEHALDMALNTYEYNNVVALDDPISDAYLPYSQNVYSKSVKSPEQNNYEYAIISLYKTILERTPTGAEVERYVKQFLEKELDESMLRVILLNSVEYRRNTKLQSNDVLSDVEYTYAKEDMISHISLVYYGELRVECPQAMIIPLRDVYVYLKSNDYLLRALIIHDNYKKFEEDIMLLKLLTKARLSELFNKYFTLYELKLLANDIKKVDVLKREKMAEEKSHELPGHPSSCLMNKIQSTSIKDVVNQNHFDQMSKIIMKEENIIDTNTISKLLQ